MDEEQIAAEKAAVEWRAKTIKKMLPAIIFGVSVALVVGAIMAIGASTTQQTPSSPIADDSTQPTSTNVVENSQQQTPSHNIDTSSAAIEQDIQQEQQIIDTMKKQYGQSAPQQTAPAATPTQTPQPTPTIYATVDLDVYTQNPAAYRNQNITILGVVDNFVPGSNGGGFVEAYNPGDFTQPAPHIEMGLSDEADYTVAVNGLQLGTSSVILAKFYGTGAQSQSFTLTNGGQTTFPVVNVTRIDRCIHGNLSGMVVKGSKLSDIATCSEWKTIFP